jgi:hypothetical protein
MRFADPPLCVKGKPISGWRTCQQRSKLPTMRRRTTILIGAGVLILVVVVVVCFAAHRPMPPDPVYRGRPVSQWVDGTAMRQGVSDDEVNRVLNSMDSNAVPWLVWYLKKNSRSFDQPLLRAELRLARYKNGALVTNGISRLADKLGRRNSALALLSQYAPGTCFEEKAARAILESKSVLGDSDRGRILALGSFTRRPDLVLPVLCAGLTNAATGSASVGALSRFGSAAITNVYRMAMAESGTNGPVASALLYLDGNAWKSCVAEKQRRR